MPRVLLIVNPGAQRLTAHRRRAVVERLATSAELEIEETRHRGHACELARLATRDGIDAVVVFGGDGTVNEAVNGRHLPPGPPFPDAAIGRTDGRPGGR